MKKIPLAFEQRIRTQWPDFAGDLLHALTLPTPVSVRYNPVKLPPEFPAAESISWAAHGRYLSARPSFTLDPLFHAGTYYVQEASSMILEKVLSNVLPVSAVLDLSAAPGGKSTHLLALMGGKGVLVANEIVRPRMHILDENLIKWGNPNVIVTHSEPTDFSGLNNVFDLAVVDAPCSGEGMFRKDETAIREWKPNLGAFCQNRQEKILDAVLPAIKPGGYLYYSTCTFFPGENEIQAKRLIDTGDWEEVIPDFPDLDNCWRAPCGYYCLPHKLQGEGYYFVLLRKKGVYTAAIQNTREYRKETRSLPFSLPEKGKRVRLRQTEYWVTPETEQVAGMLEFPVKIHRIGLPVWENEMPHHAVAMWPEMRNAFPAIELEGSDAICFLQRKEFTPDTLPDADIVQVRYKGIPLGFIRIKNDKIENLYPAHWKIRMQA